LPIDAIEKFCRGQEERMIQELTAWWRGYSEEDMENVRDRLSYSKSGGIYVTGPERLALEICAFCAKPRIAERSKTSRSPDREGSEGRSMAKL